MIPLALFRRPDVEAWLWLNIRHLPGLTSFAYAAEQLDPAWIWAVSVQVDARAKTKHAAHQLAEDARLIVAALPFTPWEDGTVSAAKPVEGPFWLPDDDGAPRYCARYELRVHPRRDAASLALSMAAARGTVGRKPQWHHPQQ